MKIKILPIISALFLVVAMAIQSAVSYDREKDSLLNLIENRMELAQKDFIYEVYDMYEVTDEISDFFPDFCENTDDMNSMLKSILERFPDLYCCYIAFLPECAPEKGKRFAPLAFREPDSSVVAYDYGDKVDYLKREWYIGALQSDNDGYWSQPYNDGIHEDPIFTHSRKLYNNDGKLIGVAGADYTLAWTERMLKDVKPYEDAVCKLYSTKGTLIAESESDDMKGMIVMEKTISPTNMRLVIGVPKSRVFKAVRGISLLTLAVLLMGILIAGWLIRRIWRDQADYARVETAKKLMDKELQIASNIQKGILRGKSEEVHSGTATNDEIKKEAVVQAVLEPMHEVGGDLYDYYSKGEDLFFIIGDVSGKGVPAAMFMSATVNLFRSAVLRLQSPKAIMEEINGVLSGHNPSLMFVTAIIGRLHIPTGQLLYCNAGHLPPLNILAGHGDRNIDPSLGQVPVPMTQEIAIEPNLPLGFEAKFRFVEQGLMLGQGDTLVLYTDGITEARNKDRELLGMKRWKEIVGGGEKSHTKTGNITPTIERLLAEVEAYIGEAEHTDDITLMTIRKMSEKQPVVMRVPNKIDQWPVLREALQNYGLCVGVDARTLKKMIVALEEAVVNVINYSQADYISLTMDHGPLTITLTDNGIAFDPTARPEVDTDQVVAERQIGGLGIALLRQIADKVEYRRTDGQNELIIIKNI